MHYFLVLLIKHDMWSFLEFLQIICNSDLKIIDVDATKTGRTHDSYILHDSCVGNALSSGLFGDVSKVTSHSVWFLILQNKYTCVMHLYASFHNLRVASASDPDRTVTKKNRKEMYFELTFCKRCVSL